MSRPAAKQVPADQLYWGLLDTSGLPPIPFGQFRPGAVGRRLGHQFDPVLPRAVEEIHAVYLPLGDDRVLACGMDREQVAALRDMGIDAAAPESIPAPLQSSIGTRVDVTRLNLLTGEFRPLAAARRRATRVRLVSAAVLVASVLVALGNHRRASVFQAAATALRARQIELYDHALGASARAGPTPASVRLATELRRLSATRAESASYQPPKAGFDLQDVLARWPRGAEIRVERLALTATRVDITVEAANAAAIQSLLDALGELDGWTLVANRVDQTSGGGKESVRARLGFERSGKGESS